MAKEIIVETSARHVHLCNKALTALFGEGYQLTHKRIYLNQANMLVRKE